MLMVCSLPASVRLPSSASVWLSWEKTTLHCVFFCFPPHAWLRFSFRFWRGTVVLTEIHFPTIGFRSVFFLLDTLNPRKLCQMSAGIWNFEVQGVENLCRTHRESQKGLAMLSEKWTFERITLRGHTRVLVRVVTWPAPSTSAQGCFNIKITLAARAGLWNIAMRKWDVFHVLHRATRQTLSFSL